MRCYCSICRKTAGGGGYAINLGGDAETLRVEGEDNLTIYRVRAAGEAEPSSGWPELVHPFASAIDTPLPVPPERVHILLDSKANWVQVPEGPAERHFAEYPEDSIVEWHDKHGLTAP
jgi:hypothetical protein